MDLNNEVNLNTQDLKLKEILMILKDYQWSHDNGTAVDGGIWYAVSAKKDVANWLRTTYADAHKQLWFDTGSANSHIDRFDVHESIFNLMLIVWPKNTS